MKKITVIIIFMALMFLALGAYDNSEGGTAQVGIGDPFVNSAGGDYHLKIRTDTGKVLPSPYDIDKDGNTRGLDGVWDRGVYQYIPKPAFFTSLKVFIDSAVGVEKYKMMLIRNDSDSKIIISKIVVEGKDFRVSTTLPKILDIGKSITFRVYFKPAEKGLRLGKIFIISDKGTVEKGLSGNGI